MKRTSTILIATAAMFALWSCDLLGNGSDGSGDDTLQQPVDSTALAPADSLLTVQGEAVDGSRRNIYVQVGDSIYSFELDPSISVEWEVGDTLIVRYKSLEQGDSVVEVKNISA